MILGEGCLIPLGSLGDRSRSACRVRVGASYLGSCYHAVFSDLHTICSVADVVSVMRNVFHIM